MPIRFNAAALVALAVVAPITNAQRGPAAPSGPAPTVADIDYAPADPANGKGHKLDLYLPSGARTPVPVVVWTGGSAWMSDQGKGRAELIAAHLNPLGYAVAGVSIRSSAQVKFPGNSTT